MRLFRVCAALVIASVATAPAWADSIYISSFNNNSVYKVDATTGALQQTISAPGALVSPTGLALSDDGSTLYVSGTNSSKADVYVFDAGSGDLIKQFSSSVTGGAGLALSADGSKLYQSGLGSGTIEVYDTTTGVGVLGANFLNKPQGLALTADGKSLFVAMAGANRVQEFAIVSGGTNRNLDAPAPYYSPSDVELSPDGSTLYVSTFGDSIATNNQILRYDVASGALLGIWTISGPVGDLYALTINPDGSKLYVADSYNGLIYTVDTATGASSSFHTTAPIDGLGAILYAPAAVPEPSSLLLCGIGTALGLVAASRRRARRDR